MATIDPALMSQFSQYFDPSAFNTPAGGGNKSSGSNPFMDLISLSDPVFGMLFGGSDPSWKPYVDANGNYVWTDPNKKNPVPVASVPGASLKPSKQYRDMAGNIQALTDLLPQYSKVVAGQAIPQAQASLAAAQATSPGYAQLMQELYSQYGPALNEIGNQIAKQNALAQVGTDTAALQSASAPGGLIESAQEAARKYDPEYFATRALTASRLGDLLNNINLDSGLTPTENREIAQGLATEGAQRGTLNAPSQLETVGNAMQYGQAGYQRVQQNRSALTAAINAATNAIPALKSGTDVFQVATGRSSTPNTGQAQFTGIPQTGALQNASSLASGLLNNTVSTQQNNAQLALQNKLGSKDWADYLNQVTSSIGNIAGAAGGIAGMCWIARRVFGDSRWLLFRHWLLNKAPDSFRELYKRHGESLAKRLSDSDITKLKTIFMDILTKEQYV